MTCNRQELNERAAALCDELYSTGSAAGRADSRGGGCSGGVGPDHITATIVQQPIGVGCDVPGTRSVSGATSTTRVPCVVGIGREGRRGKERQCESGDACGLEEIL